MVTKRHRRSLRKPIVWFGIILLMSVLIIELFHYQQRTKLSTNGPVSRQVILFQESIIKNRKPAPTLAALQYAYVASTYADALQVSDQAAAVQSSAKMLKLLYPEDSADIEAAMTNILRQNHLSYSTADVQDVSSRYRQRYENDGHNLIWSGVVPKGPGKWLKLTSNDPFTPRAGEWKRWNVTQPITVPPPPAYGSAEDTRQLEIVSQVSARRTGEDINRINFWGGTPGSETPAGIWQNQLYTTVKPALPGRAVTADKDYAVLQKSTAQAVSDAFMECWKVKYTYWTARPSMRLPGLQTAMNDPNFPSYISGHSTISKAAAEVLSITAPQYRNKWQAMAVEARDSRLKAGIHFDIDNAVGFDVGTAVAQQTVTNLKLSPVLRSR